MFVGVETGVVPSPRVFLAHGMVGLVWLLPALSETPSFLA
jgi:hypothetical protein